MSLNFDYLLMKTTRRIKFYASVLLPLLTITLNAQWSLTNNNIWNTNSGGNVGIGTNIPGKTLEVSGLSSTSGIRLRNTDGVYPGYMDFYNDGSAHFAADNTGVKAVYFSGNNIGFRTTYAGVSNVLINSSGYVGIGTTYCSDRLTICGNSTWVGQSIKSFSASGGTYIDFYKSNGVQFGGFYMDEANSQIAFRTYTGTNGRIKFQTNSTDRMMITETGNIGIGCDPGVELFKAYKSVNPNIQLSSDYSRLEFGVGTLDGCYANGAKKGDGVIRTIGGSHNTILSMPDTGGGGNCYIGIGDDSSPDPSTSLWAKFCNNKVLRVNGTIIATEMDVQSNVWADNVFESDYELKSLAEIETYIKANKHLPEIPTTTEVKENGINVAKINVLLLKKIEELTLLMIEQNKTIGELQNKVSKLKK
ncbi:MAG: hypothetical protein WCG08_12160 [Paludibacter sp.]